MNLFKSQVHESNFSGVIWADLDSLKNMRYWPIKRVLLGPAFASRLSRDLKGLPNSTRDSKMSLISNLTWVSLNDLTFGREIWIRGEKKEGKPTAQKRDFIQVYNGKYRASNALTWEKSRLAKNFKTGGETPAAPEP